MYVAQICVCCQCPQPAVYTRACTHVQTHTHTHTHCTYPATAWPTCAGACLGTSIPTSDPASPPLPSNNSRWWYHGAAGCGGSPATASSTDPAEDLHQLRQVVLDSGSIIHACLGKQEGPVQARRETRERKAYVNMHVPPFSFQIE